MLNQEEERAIMQARANNVATPMYQGLFREISLELDWYCPQCAPKMVKLKRTNDDLGLYCDNDPYCCEYSYYNKAGREKYNVYWFKCFEYPLGPRELHDKQIKHKLANIKECEQEIELNQRLIKKLERACPAADPWLNRKRSAIAV